MNFTILHIDHIVLRAADTTAMIAFYVEVLGCSLEQVQEPLGLYQLRAGTALIDLIAIDGELGRAGGAAPGPEGRNLDHFCLRIEPFDPEALAYHLDARGVAHGPVESRYGAEGRGPSLYVTDPEGNVIELKGPPGPAVYG